MKKQPGKEMVIYGSSSIVSAFMNLGLIDEYYLFVNPIVLGRGKPLFKDLNDKHKLKLLRTKTFSNGVVLLHYQSDIKEAIKA
jgi:dihydrofolate reductase